MSKATDFKFVVRVHVDIFSKRTNTNPVKGRGLGHVTSQLAINIYECSSGVRECSVISKCLAYIRGMFAGNVPVRTFCQR